MDKRTRQKTVRKHAPTRPNLTRGSDRIPKVTRNGQRDTVAAKPQVTDKRPAWLREHGPACACIACFNYKPDVMAIYTGNPKYPYRCPYCGSYRPNSKEIKVHMGKMPNLGASCPQLQSGVFEQAKIQYRDSGDMRLLDA